MSEKVTLGRLEQDAVGRAGFAGPGGIRAPGTTAGGRAKPPSSHWCATPHSSHDVCARCERDARTARPAANGWDDQARSVAIQLGSSATKRAQVGMGAQAHNRPAIIATAPLPTRHRHGRGQWHRHARAGAGNRCTRRYPHPQTRLCVMRKTRVGGSVWNARIALPRTAAESGRHWARQMSRSMRRGGRRVARPAGMRGQARLCAPGIRARSPMRTCAAAPNQVSALQADAGQQLLDLAQAVGVLAEDDGLPMQRNNV